MTITPAAASIAGAALGALPRDALLAALSRLSVHTDDAIFWSRDFPGNDGNRDLVVALLGLAARGAQEIGYGDQLKGRFTGLYNDDGPYGDWIVTASRERLPFPQRTGDMDAEQTLARLDVSALREVLSTMIDEIPESVILPAGFAEDTEVKPLAGEQQVLATSRMMLNTCSALRDTLTPGDSVRITFDSVFRGCAGGSRWSILVNRLSSGA